MKKRTIRILAPLVAISGYVISYVMGIRDGEFLKSVREECATYGSQLPYQFLNLIYRPLFEIDEYLVKVPAFRRSVTGRWNDKLPGLKQQQHENGFNIEITGDGSYTCEIFGMEHKSRFLFDRSKWAYGDHFTGQHQGTVFLEIRLVKGPCERLQAKLIDDLGQEEIVSLGRAE